MIVWVKADTYIPIHGRSFQRFDPLIRGDICEKKMSDGSREVEEKRRGERRGEEVKQVGLDFVGKAKKQGALCTAYIYIYMHVCVYI